MFKNIINVVSLLLFSTLAQAMQEENNKENDLSKQCTFLARENQVLPKEEKESWLENRNTILVAANINNLVAGSIVSAFNACLTWQILNHFNGIVRYYSNKQLFSKEYDFDLGSKSKSLHKNYFNLATKSLLLLASGHLAAYFFRKGLIKEKEIIIGKIAKINKIE